jgi:hypothetical protein
MAADVPVEKRNHHAMSTILRIIRAALTDLADDLFTTAVVHLLWLVLTLLVVTSAPATMALFYVANRKARGEVTDVGDFLYAMRRYFVPGWRWGLVNGFVVFFLVGDIFLTGRIMQGPTAQWIQGLYLALLVMWLFLQLYALPLLFEQREWSQQQAWRNAAVMLGRNIGFSLILAVALVILLALSTLFVVVIATAGALLVALVANHAVINRLDVTAWN